MCWVTHNFYCTSVWRIPHIWLSEISTFPPLLIGFFGSFSLLLLLLRVKDRGCYALLSPMRQLWFVNMGFRNKTWLMIDCNCVRVTVILDKAIWSRAWTIFILHWCTDSSQHVKYQRISSDHSYLRLTFWTLLGSLQTLDRLEGPAKESLVVYDIIDMNYQMLVQWNKRGQETVRTLETNYQLSVNTEPKPQSHWGRPQDEAWSFTH